MPKSTASSLRRIAAFGAALVLSACSPAPSSAPSATSGPATSSPSPSLVPRASQAQASEVYAAIRTKVEQIRGLQPTASVDPVTIDVTQLRTNLEAEFDKENTAADLKFSEDELTVLHLLPAGSSLRTLTLDFQGSNVAGYYSPEAKQLFVVSRSGGIGPAEEVTYAHEFTHQLQDQHFDLSKLGEDATNQSDRALAQLSLVEGDAVSVQNEWTLQSLTPEEVGQLLGASLDPEALAALQRAPAYLRETSLFPYTGGLGLVTALAAQGGYDRVNAAYAKAPASTEQILHPEKYVAGEAPVAIALPSGLAAALGTGWTDAGQDTLGEFVLRLWLTQNGVTVADASRAAAGWGGDRLVLLQGPGGETTIAMATEWDTAADADEFMTAALSAMQAGHLDGTVRRRKAGSTRILVAIGPKADQLVALLAG